MNTDFKSTQFVLPLKPKGRQLFLRWFQPAFKHVPAGVLIALCLLLSSTTFANKTSEGGEGENTSNSALVMKSTLSGYLRDAKNGEALIGATVYVPKLQIGVVSNAYGFYSLSMPEGKFEVHVSYIGYETQIFTIDMAISNKLNVKLKESTEMIQEVVVTSEAKNKNVESVTMSMEKVSVKTIKKLPAFMGEVDVIKSIQLLPGIQSGGEGSSGLYVRGGGPDENLLLLDEAPVYNASHLVGFVSVFNSDAIKDIAVYKGGIPAQYGGKASSVIDIRQKDGNSQRFGFNGGVGLLSSRLTLQGPVVVDKGSFIVSGRLFYAPLLGQAAGINALQGNDLYFYDLNAKINYTLTDKDRIYVSAYNGDDKFTLGESLYMRWGNTTLTTRWNHVFGQSLFTNTSLVFSQYGYNLGVPGNEADNFDWSSMIRDWNLKIDNSYFINPQNQVKFGINLIHHHFQPGNIKVSDSSYFSDTEFTRYNALEGAAYVSNEQKIGSRITLQYGVRYSYFQQLGSGKVRNYADPENIGNSVVTDTLEYGWFEKIGNPFQHLEPRLSTKFTLNGNSSIKASYNRMVQNLHLISNTNSPTPVDIWLPSSKYIKPLIIDQVALGYFRNFKDNAIETSIEAYYKDMNNVLDYIEGAELLFNDALETELLHGTGHSYGLELLLKKQQGDFTGWVGYTWAKTMRKIPGINNGKEYPSSFDRTHDLSVVASYQVSPQWNLATNFVFATGNPYTVPVAKYEIDGNQLYVYSEKNGYRMPNYHRLDFSATYDWKKNATRKYKQSLNISVYNVYARRNAYSISFRANETNPNLTDAVRLSIIGTVIPSITYNFEF